MNRRPMITHKAGYLLAEQGEKAGHLLVGPDYRIDGDCKMVRLSEADVKCLLEGNSGMADKVIEAVDEINIRNMEIDRLEAENERLRTGLDAAIRAANLALFVIRKQGVMPNSSWQGGFERDMAAANEALVNEPIPPR